MKKRLMLAVLAAIGMTAAHAAAPTCEAQADTKKLSGAARNSFVTKCEKDGAAAAAKKSCEAQAAEKKLHGAAQNSFTQKCIKDATAAAK